MAGNYACPQCSAVFSTEKGLRQHSQKHNDPIWICEKCSKAFTFQSNYIEHLSIHTDLKYECPKCDVEIRLQGNLKKHVIKHHLNDKEKQNKKLGDKVLNEIMAKANEAFAQLKMSKKLESAENKNPQPMDSEEKENDENVPSKQQKIKSERSNKRKEGSDEEDFEDGSEMEDTDLPKTSERARRNQMLRQDLEEETLDTDDDTPVFRSVIRSSAARVAGLRGRNLPESENEQAAAQKPSENDSDSDTEPIVNVPMRRMVPTRFSPRSLRKGGRKPAETESDDEVLVPARRTENIKRVQSTQKRVNGQPSTSDSNPAKKQKNAVIYNSGLVCCDLPLILPYNVSNRICNGPQLEAKAKRGRKSKKTKENKENQDVEAPKTECRIAPGSQYMDHKMTHQEYCIPCFNNVTADRQSYSEKTNRNEKSEDILECRKCKETRHRCCTTYRGARTKFICENCWTPMDSKVLKDPKLFKVLNNDPRYTSAFSKKIEERLNRLQGRNDNPISARVLLSKSKTVNTKNLAPELYHQEFEARFSKKISYRTRTLLLFQRQRGGASCEKRDILFFILFADEYKNMEDEKSYFNIDYLDTAELLTDPGKCRGVIYKEAILAYYEHMASQGHLHGFLWANPPLPKDDFIFNIHPENQNYRNKQSLIKWYREMIDLGKESSSEDLKREGIIEEFLDFGKMQEQGKMTTVTELPLFRGCIWQELMKKQENELEDLKGTPDAYKAQYDHCMNWHGEQHQRDNFIITLRKPSNILENLEVS